MAANPLSSLASLALALSNDLAAVDSNPKAIEITPQMDDGDENNTRSSLSDTNEDDNKDGSDGSKSNLASVEKEDNGDEDESPVGEGNPDSDSGD
jgi:hypothetical protein